MVITEAYIRNFGKFSEQHFYFHDGVQVVTGENEYGKTTIHAFIRAMLFGMERGRGEPRQRTTTPAMSRGIIRNTTRACSAFPAEGGISGLRETFPGQAGDPLWSARTTEKSCPWSTGI